MTTKKTQPKIPFSFVSATSEKRNKKNLLLVSFFQYEQDNIIIIHSFLIINTKKNQANELWACVGFSFPQRAS